MSGAEAQRDAWYPARYEAIWYFAEHDPVGFLAWVLKSITIAGQACRIRELGPLSREMAQALEAHLEHEADPLQPAGQQLDAAAAVREAERYLARRRR